TGGGGRVFETTPSNSPGAVDVYTALADGGGQLVAEGFSYGPTILEITTSAVTPDGGQAWVYGYGFGPMNSDAIPSGLQISVGSTPVTITTYHHNGYQVLGQPFPMQIAVFNIPPGAAGSLADVTVTTPAGSTTKKNAIQYLPAVQRYPL